MPPVSSGLLTLPRPICGRVLVLTLPSDIAGSWTSLMVERAGEPRRMRHDARHCYGRGYGGRCQWQGLGRGPRGWPTWTKPGERQAFTAPGLLVTNHALSATNVGGGEGMTHR